MEGFQKTIRDITKDLKSSNSSSSSSSNSEGFHGGVSDLSTDQSRILVNRASRNMVSMWVCSKLCAAFFVAGVVVGYTLKRRVRRWASRLLRRMRDD